MEKKDLFFCYSKRLQYFLKAFGLDYINGGINKNNNRQYYVYNKTEKLNKLLNKWNDMKEFISLEEICE